MLKNIIHKFYKNIKKENKNKYNLDETKNNISIIISENNKRKVLFEEYFEENISRLNFFFEKISTKTKEVEKEILELNSKGNKNKIFYKIRNYKELSKAYIIFLKDELKIMKSKNNKLENKKEFLENFLKIEKQIQSSNFFIHKSIEKFNEIYFKN